MSGPRVIQRYTNDAFGLARPWLEEAAARLAQQYGWLHYRPLTAHSFKGLNSVRLHYVWRDPSRADPLAGIENHHTVGRGRPCNPDGQRARNAKRRQERYAAGNPVLEDFALVQPKAARWSQRERSILRTLDKLIRY